MGTGGEKEGESIRTRPKLSKLELKRTRLSRSKARLRAVPTDERSVATRFLTSSVNLRNESFPHPTCSVPRHHR
jgi:hypothetical protein